ncbi:amt-3 [Symbiodinium pilosum]|uniref:Amt-3 protein n=1 Tax=Symbiodinium pilosum TaxID=2952 RepID=A0A812K3S0_SYMPI|nr:amt-3 [Symbiodinium pilosum]
MWKKILAGLVASAAAEEDASCMLQARHADSIPASVIKEEFCQGPPAELNFDSFMHGDEIMEDSIKGVNITAMRRASEPQPGQPPCPGPLRVLDTRGQMFPSIDKDLQNCGDCRMMVYAKDNLAVELKRPKVNSCGEQPGPRMSFRFKRLQNLVDIELWDLEEPTFIELYGPHDVLLANISAPQGLEQDGQPAVLELMTKGVRELVVYFGGSGAVKKIRACKPQGSVFGDPHIYTLDGDKFDFYQNGTFSVFHYSGQQLPHPKAKNATVDWQLDLFLPPVLDTGA